MTSFLFFTFSKTLLSLIKISIGGVNEGAAAIPFSRYSYFEDLNLLCETTSG